MDMYHWLSLLKMGMSSEDGYGNFDFHGGAGGSCDLSPDPSPWLGILASIIVAIIKFNC